MFLISLQLHNHVETEKLGRISLRKLFQRLLRDFAHLHSHIELFFFQAARNKPSCQTELENRIKNSEERHSA